MADVDVTDAIKTPKVSTRIFNILIIALDPADTNYY